MTKKRGTRADSPAGEVRGQSDYALENKRRQEEWELGFRERFEWLVKRMGGPGKTQEAMHITTQAFQKFRKGGSRLAFFATLCEVSGVNPTWLVLGSHSEPRFRAVTVPDDPRDHPRFRAAEDDDASGSRRLSLVAEESLDDVAVPSRRKSKKSPTGSDDARRRK